jgi:putative SOS response-associated peptidase YedK
VKSYTIITTEANDLIKALHERMAIILPQGLEKEWLDPKLTNPTDLLPMLKPYPPELMAFHQVSAAVGNTGNDNPTLTEEVRKLI